MSRSQVPEAYAHDTIGKKYAMSVAAAAVAETVTYPLDLTKTRSEYAILLLHSIYIVAS